MSSILDALRKAQAKHEEEDSAGLSESNGNAADAPSPAAFEPYPAGDLSSFDDPAPADRIAGFSVKRPNPILALGVGVLGLGLGVGVARMVSGNLHLFGGDDGKVRVAALDHRSAELLAPATDSKKSAAVAQDRRLIREARVRNSASLKVERPAAPAPVAASPDPAAAIQDAAPPQAMPPPAPPATVPSAPAPAEIDPAVAAQPGATVPVAAAGPAAIAPEEQAVTVPTAAFVQPPATLPAVATPQPGVVPGAQAPVPGAAPAAPVIVMYPTPLPAAPPAPVLPARAPGAPPVRTAAIDPPTAVAGAVAPVAGVPEPSAGTVLETVPTGAPEVSLLFIKWSRGVQGRVASLRGPGGKLMLVHEGDIVEGMRVSTIRADAVELQWRGTNFLLFAAR